MKLPFVDTGLGKVYRKVRTNRGLRTFSHTEWDEDLKMLWVIYKHPTKKQNNWRTEKFPIEQVKYGTAERI